MDKREKRALEQKFREMEEELKVIIMFYVVRLRLVSYV